MSLEPTAVTSADPQPETLEDSWISLEEQIQIFRSHHPDDHSQKLMELLLWCLDRQREDTNRLAVMIAGWNDDDD